VTWPPRSSRHGGRLGRALFTHALGAGDEDPDAGRAGFNLTRFLFLDDRSRNFYRDWETVARDAAASLRSEAGRNPYDRALTDLVGELATRSSELRTWWAAHDVKLHRTATKTFLHGVVGELEPARIRPGGRCLHRTVTPSVPVKDMPT
jgi:hypothetical protein